MTEKLIPSYLYTVRTVSGETVGFLEVVASYVRTEGGFLEFKNAVHEVVLMVNANNVISVSRAFTTVSEPRLTGGGAVTMTQRDGVSRHEVREAPARDSYDQARFDLLDHGRSSR